MTRNVGARTHNVHVKSYVQRKARQHSIATLPFHSKSKTCDSVNVMFIPCITPSFLILSLCLINIQSHLSTKANSELHVLLYALHICTSTAQFSCEALTLIQSNASCIFSKTQSQGPTAAWCSMILFAPSSTFICHPVPLVGTMPCPWGGSAWSKKLREEQSLRQGQLHTALSPSWQCLVASGQLTCSFHSSSPLCISSTFPPLYLMPLSSEQSGTELPKQLQGGFGQPQAMK